MGRKLTPSGPKFIAVKLNKFEQILKARYKAPTFKSPILNFKSPKVTTRAIVALLWQARQSDATRDPFNTAGEALFHTKAFQKYAHAHN
jgi:hypothetical protein